MKNHETGSAGIPTCAIVARPSMYKVSALLFERIWAPPWVAYYLHRQKGAGRRFARTVLTDAPGGAMLAAR